MPTKSKFFRPTYENIISQDEFEPKKNLKIENWQNWCHHIRSAILAHSVYFCDWVNELAKWNILFANHQKHLPLRTCTLIVLGSEFEGLHWNMPLWDLLTFWMISELTVTPGRQCWLKIKRTLLWLSLFDHSDTSTSWNITRVLICSCHQNNQIYDEFRILNILFTCLINSRARHSAIYKLKSRNLF